MSDEPIIDPNDWDWSDNARTILRGDENTTLADLVDHYDRHHRDAWVRYQELRVDDLTTLKRLVPAAPPIDTTVAQRFLGFPVIIDDTLPANRIHLIDKDGKIVKAWQVDAPRPETP